MTKRISPEEVREITEILREDARLTKYVMGVEDVAMTSAAETLAALAGQMEADEAERAELAATNDLFADCMDRACRMWREAHPDKPLVWPDGAKNIAWLVEQNDALAAKVQEYEARLKGRVWRPFDTAPQDETEILVYRPDAGVFTARYYPSLNEDDEWDMDNCCWFTAAGEDLTRDLPTHWMPFPDGPDQTIDKEEQK